MRNGTSLELAVCDCLIDLNVKPSPSCTYTVDRLLTGPRPTRLACVTHILRGFIRREFDDDDEKIENKNMNKKRKNETKGEGEGEQKKRKRGTRSQVLDQKEIRTKKEKERTFILQKDCAGHSRSSDIVIFEKSKNLKKGIEKEKEIHISVKSNNMSIKHPSVSNMPKQLNMDSVVGAKFKTNLSAIYDHFYKSWSKENQTLNTVTRLEKTKLYKRVNNLVAMHVRRASQENLEKFIYFLLDPETYILTCSTLKENKESTASIYKIDMNVLKESVLSFSPREKQSEKQSGKIKVRGYGSSFLLFGENGEIRLRLHTSRSALCANLALKYDVTVHKSMLQKQEYKKERKVEKETKEEKETITRRVSPRRRLS
jgi:hypothetical protein